eukprot:m.940948 g.940948  ORF g.940948 m.940948 type:complete len:426 (-) comp23831_c0_seq2:1574-2851(-)
MFHSRCLYCASCHTIPDFVSSVVQVRARKNDSYITVVLNAILHNSAKRGDEVASVQARGDPSPTLPLVIDVFAAVPKASIGAYAATEETSGMPCATNFVFNPALSSNTPAERGLCGSVHRRTGATTSTNTRTTTRTKSVAAGEVCKEPESVLEVSVPVEKLPLSSAGDTWDLVVRCSRAQPLAGDQIGGVCDVLVGVSGICGGAEVSRAAAATSILRGDTGKPLMSDTEMPLKHDTKIPLKKSDTQMPLTDVAYTVYVVHGGRALALRSVYGSLGDDAVSKDAEPTADVGACEGGRCVICMEEPALVVLLPCAHMCICTHCLPQLTSSRCPLCRSGVEKVLETVAAVAECRHPDVFPELSAKCTQRRQPPTTETPGGTVDLHSWVLWMDAHGHATPPVAAQYLGMSWRAVWIGVTLFFPMYTCGT